MSQVSKKSSNLPVRKRLKPTVNLNVASRRRKDAKDVQSVTDVQPEQPESKNNSSQEYTKEDSLSHSISNKSKESPSDCHIKDNENELDTTFESEKSFSSARTLLWQHARDDVNRGSQAKIVKLQEASNSKDSSSRSVSSSVSTVLLTRNQHESFQKKSLKDLLEQSIDSLDELDDLATPDAVIENNAIPCALETVDEKGQNELFNARNNYEKSIVSDASQQGSFSEHANNHERCIEDISQRFENDSGSSDIPVALPQEERNVDIDSLNDDSISSVSEHNNLRQDFDMPPPKCKRKVSAMAKRLSEARRDFENRFCKKKPERSALRMFDLIYYNPSTNPMKTTPDKPKEVVINSSDELDSSRAVEEDVDNPAEEENVEDDTDNGIPAPRVKVGPNGEIVLDEQSLVIETTQSKKSRQEIANLTVVVDTGSNTTYHTYSKKKRTRSDWTVKETVRFYKALQTLGTDFSLMQTLFPSRSRLDLKSKFKKEERINGHLIEKALRFPSLFDLSELEKEQSNEGKKESSTKKRKTSQKRQKKRSLKSLGFDEEDCGPPLKKKRKRGVKTLYQRNCDKDTGKENVETQPQECTSDEEYHPPAGEEEKSESPKRTTERRSSRLLNGKTASCTARENKHDFLEAGIDLLESSDSEEENNPGDENVISEEVVPTIINSFDANNMQPGSLVIVTSQYPDNPGYQICNVFMVQERSNMSCENAVFSSTAEFSTQPDTRDISVVNTGSITEPS